VHLAVSHLQHALLLLRTHTRALPTAHADVLLALGRKLRLLGGAGGGRRGVGRGWLGSSQGGPMSARSAGGSSGAPAAAGSGSPSSPSSGLGRDTGHPASPDRQSVAAASGGRGDMARPGDQQQAGSGAGDSAGGGSSSITTQAEFLARATDMLTQVSRYCGSGHWVLKPTASHLMATSWCHGLTLVQPS
jgi:hypothetical protein